MGVVEPFRFLIQAAVVVFVLWFALSLVRAVEGIERSVARAVSQYERMPP